MSAESHLFSAEEAGELADALGRGDFTGVAHLLRIKGAPDCLCQHIETTKHPRSGVRDAGKERRDHQKALFKGYFNYLRQIDKHTAFYTALKEFPELDESVADRIANGKFGEINRLARALPNPHVERHRKS